MSFTLSEQASNILLIAAVCILVILFFLFIYYVYHCSADKTNVNQKGKNDSEDEQSQIREQLKNFYEPKGKNETQLQDLFLEQIERFYNEPI
jgi:competence protein ComGC